MKSFRMSVDIGGTFTDVVQFNQNTGEIKTCKVLTTSGELHKGVLEGINSLVTEFNTIDFFVHGTTSGLNALLERKGAKIALVTTEGFRDVYEIGRAHRPEMYNLFWKKSKLLVRRRDIFEVPERILFDGTIEKTLTKEAILKLAKKIAAGKYQAIAICLLHSYINPIHEEFLGQILKEQLPEIFISFSHQVANEWREYERTSTTVLNAYIAPVMESYLTVLEKEMTKGGLGKTIHIMKSNGGIMTSHLAKREAVQTFFSGPVGGTIGGQYIGDQIGEKNLICVDMGGTSFDVSLVVGGKADIGNETDLEGFPVLTPVVNIHTIGAGGGSVAWIEAGGLRVGPHSSGAKPGPACYGLGGENATVTDANVVLGRIDPEYFLGGAMKLSEDAAWQTVNNLGEKLGLTGIEIAEGIVTIANAKMTNAIREITVFKGIDPREFALVAYGGAGPMHAVFLANELGINKIIVPYSPGTFSAQGMLMTDIRHDFVQTFYSLAKTVKNSIVDTAFRKIEMRGIELLNEDGVYSDQIKLMRSVDMRYVGQEYTVTVPLVTQSADSLEPDNIYQKFHQMHYQRYGHNNPIEEVEYVNLRVTAIGRIPRVKVTGQQIFEAGEPKSVKVKQIYFGKEYQETKVYLRKFLRSGYEFHGPAIVEEQSCTIVIPPGYKANVDQYGNIIITQQPNNRRGK